MLKAPDSTLKTTLKAQVSRFLRHSYIEKQVSVGKMMRPVVLVEENEEEEEEEEVMVLIILFRLWDMLDNDFE